MYHYFTECESRSKTDSILYSKRDVQVQHVDVRRTTTDKGHLVFKCAKKKNTFTFPKVTPDILLPVFKITAYHIQCNNKYHVF